MNPRVLSRISRSGACVVALALGSALLLWAAPVQAGPGDAGASGNPDSGPSGGSSDEGLAGSGATDVGMELQLGVENAHRGTSKGAAIESDIDLANIVTTAAKGITTVQEAPAIVTVLTADDFKKHGVRTIMQALALIPGWAPYEAEWGQAPSPMTRGTVQAVLILHDGVSMFDGTNNVAMIEQSIPIESVARIEVITGPGGVLWGANSYLGIVNIITKDGGDVHGVEASAGWGSGPGMTNDFRAYAMGGGSRHIFGIPAQIFAHVSYERWQGPIYTLTPVLAGSPAPQPVGPFVVGSPDTSNPDMSDLVILDGKASLGPLSLLWGVPIGTTRRSVGWQSNPIHPFPCAAGQTGSCNNAYDDVWDYYDRYAILDYKTRFLADTAGIDVKGYYTQFERSFGPTSVYPPNASLLPGGLVFEGDLTSTRWGAAMDSDWAIGSSFKLLAGAEAFKEGEPGSEARFLGPTDLHKLPLPCPVDSSGNLVPECPLPFVFAANRGVVGVYGDGQYHPFDALTLDGGARYQVAPWGTRTYGSQVLFSGSAVVQLVRDVHLKLNYAEGFRPPVFNDTDANGQAVDFGGSPDLSVERSRAFQAEVNARLLRGAKHIRELIVRADGSYTILTGLIQVENGRYKNSGRRGIAEGEFLGKLYLEGDDELDLGYTFLRTTAQDVGTIKALPAQWFTLSGYLNVTRHVDLSADLFVYGSFDDPNRYFPPSSGCAANLNCSVQASDIVFDHVPAAAVVNAGIRVRHLIDGRLTLDARIYNLLGGTSFYPDPFYALDPALEFRPEPFPGLSFFAKAVYTY